MFRSSLSHSPSPPPPRLHTYLSSGSLLRVTSNDWDTLFSVYPASDSSLLGPSLFWLRLSSVGNAGEGSVSNVAQRLFSLCKSLAIWSIYTFKTSALQLYSVFKWLTATVAWWVNSPVMQVCNHGNRWQQSVPAKTLIKFFTDPTLCF